MVFAATLALGTALLLAALIAIDPYDSGRFGFLGITGVSDINANTANASRARDPHFDSAIIGDSTGQLLKPSELSRLTGLRFVQLTVPGTGPREQIAILDFFARHHAQIGAIVIAVDRIWCTRDRALPAPHPFPFWLYDSNRLEYAAHIFSVRALGRAWRRIQIGLGRRVRTAPDGFWDYGPSRFVPDAASHDTTPDFAGTVSEDFPAMARLAAALARIGDARVVLVAPPMFYTHVARPGSRLDAEETACKRALRRVAEGRPRGQFLDYRVDGALTRDPANFKDFIHVSAQAARQLEQDIAAALRDK